MPPPISNETVILGMGLTGIASARFLAAQGQIVHVMDNRDIPPGLANVQALQRQYPQLSYCVGHFDSNRLRQAREVIISPGLALSHPDFAAAQAIGVPFVSEIELFARYVNAPVVAITGSNGKSTVTTLVAQMAKAAGLTVQVGGNLGIPAVALLQTPPPDLYVLELSSFQLECTYSLRPAAAVVLNLSADHMDRYPSLLAYAQAKARIYHTETINVINADDPQVVAMLPAGYPALSFSLHSQQATFCVCQHQHADWLARYADDHLTPLLPVTDLLMSGQIMQANALAALALGEAVGLPMSAMLSALRHFHGLPHRCALVCRDQQVDWYNDSKGTNVGATVAAIQTLDRPGRLVLIAGGDGKGADFTPLVPIAAQQLRACVTLGQDGDKIGALLQPLLPVQAAIDMTDAVQKARQLAQPGDAVLLSPACSSLDMFRNYEHRGEVFTAAVLALTQQ